MKWGKRSAELECVWMLVINFDYSCVMHAVWILVAEWGGVLSYSMVTGENLYVPDKPAGILLSKYSMLRQKKKKKRKGKITEVYEAEGIHYSIIFEPLCKSLPSTNHWPSDPFAFSSTSSHTHTALYSHFVPDNRWPFFKEHFGIWAFYLVFALSWLSVTGTSGALIYLTELYYLLYSQHVMQVIFNVSLRLHYW